METFSALLAICAVTGEIPSQRPVTRSFASHLLHIMSKRLEFQLFHAHITSNAAEYFCYHRCPLRLLKYGMNINHEWIHGDVGMSC